MDMKAHMDAVAKGLQAVTDEYKKGISAVLGMEVEVIAIVNVPHSGSNHSLILSDITDLIHACNLMQRGSIQMQHMVHESFPAASDAIN